MPAHADINAVAPLAASRPERNPTTEPPASATNCRCGRDPPPPFPRGIVPRGQRLRNVEALFLRDGDGRALPDAEYYTRVDKSCTATESALRFLHIEGCFGAGPEASARLRSSGLR